MEVNFKIRYPCKWTIWYQEKFEAVKSYMDLNPVCFLLPGASQVNKILIFIDL
jgi:hypothetical protein